jgi:hypothetical protein
MRSLAEFRNDTRGLSGWTIVQVLLVLLVPVALFVFWYQYLRRIQANENAKNGPWMWGNRGAARPMAMASLGDEKRQCSRCGLTVRPPRGSGPPTCPNCMNTL